MYNISRLTHPDHGNVITIDRSLSGSCKTPFQAIQKAQKEARLWKETGVKKIRILVDEQVISTKQAETWANEEYQTLVKCQGCGKVLKEGLIYNHQLSLDFFCSQDCSDRDYNQQLEKLNDEEDIEYL